MSKLENDFTYIGYPCFSKIINQLNNVADIPEYTAFTLSVLKTDKVENPVLLVMAQESNLLPESPIKNTDLICFREGITEENVFETLMSEPRIKKYKNCTRYYKKFDSKLSMCKLCPRSPYFKNQYINEEYALLKFVLSEQTNMKYFKSLLKKYPAFRFRVVEDLAAEYRTKNTYVYDCNAVFFECLKKHEDILYYSYNNYTIILKSSFSKAVKEGRRLPNTISERENWSMVAMDKILKRIDEAKDFTREEVEQFFIRWNEEEKQREEVIKEYERMVADSLYEKTTTHILDFAPKTEKVVQKKKQAAKKSSNQSEEKQPYDPRNFIIPSEDTEYIYNFNTDTAHTDNKQPQEEPAMSKGPDTKTEDNKEQHTDNAEASIPEKGVKEKMEAPVTDTPSKEEDIHIQPELAEIKTTDNTVSLEPEYSDEDLLFNMYSENINDFCPEPEDIIYPDNTEYEMNGSEEYDNDTDEPLFEDLADCNRELPAILNVQQTQDFTRSTNNTGTALIIRKEALVTSFNYPDIGEFDDTLPFREIEQLPMERQLILEQTISNELLEQCRPLTEDLVLLAEIETAILKERYFCIELVKDKKGNEVFLFYIHKLHRYYYTRMDTKNVREVFLPLFKTPSVTKYCYLPYYIYGYCVCKDIKLRSLTSIFTLQACTTEDKTLSLGDLCVKYMPYGQQALKRALENASPNQWFYGIAYYRTIASKIKAENALLKQKEALDEVLGISYLAKRSFYSEDRLFSMGNDGDLIFQNEAYISWLKKVRFDGYSVRYTVSAENQIQKESIITMLTYLSAKGYFKKRQIQIIALNDTTVYFYIGKEDFHYLDTIIQTYLFQYGKHIEEYHTGISYEFYTAQK